MPRASRIKPISYLKANAAEILAELQVLKEPMIITQNGEAKAVLQDYESYEQLQETLALLKILAMGKKEIEEGKYVTLVEAKKRMKKFMKQL